jgi:hypothetical protein
VQDGSEPFSYRVHSGPSRTANLGESVRLDTRRALPIRFHPSSGNIHVRRPSGATHVPVPLDTTVPEHPVLVPDAPGLWLASAVQFQTDPAYIAVGVPYPPTPRVGLIRRPNSIAVSRLLAEDLDGSGRITVVAAEYDDWPSPRGRITTVTALGDGRVSAPTVIDENGAQGLVAIDIDGNGRKDLLALRDNTLYVLANGSDGSFQTRSRTQFTPCSARMSNRWASWPSRSW